MTQLTSKQKKSSLVDEFGIIRRFRLINTITKKLTHSLSVFPDFISVRSASSNSDNHTLIIGDPDSSIEPDKNFDTSIYVCDHAHVLIKGRQKGDLEIYIKTDEYPTKISVNGKEV